MPDARDGIVGVNIGDKGGVGEKNAGGGERTEGGLG